MSNQTIALDTITAVGLTPPAGAKYALITIEHASATGDAVRFWSDARASAPTATTGHLLKIGQSIDLPKHVLNTVKFIAIIANVTIQVGYEYE